MRQFETEASGMAKLNHPVKASCSPQMLLTGDSCCTASSYLETKNSANPLLDPT